MAFAGVVDLEAGGSEGVEQGLDARNQSLDGGEGVALLGEVAAWRADYSCKTVMF